MSRRPFSTSAIKKPPPSPHYPENAPPTHTLPSGQTGYITATKYFSVAGGNALVLGDVDTPLVTATLTTTLGTLEVVPNPSVRIVNNISDRVIMIGSVVNVNRALDGMRLTPPVGYSGGITIALRTTDGRNIKEDSFIVTIAGAAPPPPPQPPMNYVNPIARSTPYQTAYAFPANSISVYDADSPNVTASITASDGVCSVSLQGSVVEAGNGTNYLSIFGPQAEVNATLNTLIFTPPAAFSGVASLELRAFDGALEDRDIISIVVQSPVYGPINSVPGQQTLNRNTTYQLRSFPNNAEFRIAAAYKPTLQTKLKCLAGTLECKSTSSVGGVLADGFPAKIMYGQWPNYGTQAILSVQSGCTAIGLWCIRNSGPQLDNGAVSWPYPGKPSALDVQTLRARGIKIMLIIGDGGNYKFWYTTRQQSNNLLNSLTPYIDSIGGVDGVDFNCLDSAPGGTIQGPEIVYIAQQLKLMYGTNFAIAVTLRNWNDLKSTVFALRDASCLTWLNVLYVDWPAYKSVGAVTSTNQAIMNESGIPGTRMMLGFSSNYNYSSSLTQAECTREWDSVVASVPSIRGVSCYTTELDAAAPSYGGFVSMFRNSKFGNAGSPGLAAAIAGQNTPELTFVGNLTQINFCLSWVDYTPEAAFYGIDTVRMTTTDGTLSDVDTVQMNIL